MRIIVTDGTASLRNVDKNDQIIVICDESKMCFSILEYQTQMISAPDGAAAFCLGVIAGQYANTPNDVVVVTNNPAIQRAAQTFGFLLCPEEEKKAPAKRTKRKKNAEK